MHVSSGDRSEGSAAGDDAGRRPALHWALVLAGYLAGAVAITWPLLLRLGTDTLPGHAADQSQYMWNIDTFWMNVRDGQNPFFTTRVMFPIGANLMHTGFAPFVSLFAWPFLGRLPLYLSLVTLVAFPAAALGACLVVRALTGRFTVAAVAGLLYGLGPFIISFAEASHTYKVVAAALLPYGLVAAVRFIERGHMRALVALSAVTWALLFTDYYLLVVHVVLTATVGIACVRPRHLLPAGLTLAVNLLLALALIHWVLPPLSPDDLSSGGPYFWSHANANLVDYLVPRAANPVLGRLAAYAADRPNGDVDYFLGWGILALAVHGAWRERQRPMICALAAAGLFLLALSCGTAIRVGRLEILHDQWTAWHWLAQLPTLAYLDLPRCFSIGPALAVAALAGVELAAWRRARRAIACALALFVVEYGQLGMPLSSYPVPPVYHRLAAAPDARTLLELPSGLTESKGGPHLNFGLNYTDIKNNPQMYWQTVHRKPRVGAYLSRIPQSTYRWFGEQPVMSDLLIFTSSDRTWNGRRVDALPDYPPEVVERFRGTFNLGYVLLQPIPQQAAYARAIERLLAGRIAARESDETGYLLYTLVPDR